MEIQNNSELIEGTKFTETGQKVFNYLMKDKNSTNSLFFNQDNNLEDMDEFYMDDGDDDVDDGDVGDDEDGSSQNGSDDEMDSLDEELYNEVEGGGRGRFF